MSVNSDASYNDKLKDLREFLSKKIDKKKLINEEIEVYEFVLSNRNWVAFESPNVKRTLLTKGDIKKGLEHIIIRHYGNGADSELSAWDVIRIGKTILSGSALTDVEIERNRNKLGHSKKAFRRLAGNKMYIVGLGDEKNGDNLVITYYKADL